MAKIYQTFNLVEEEEEKKKLKQIQKGRGENLVKELKNKGYIVLVSGDYFRGVPTSIIIGAEVEAELPNIKGDFTKIANNLGIAYQSGHWYQETK